MYNNAITKDLIKELNMSLEHVESVDIIVSFIQESGFYQIRDLLNEATRRNITVRIITSTYLSITNPTALSLLFYTEDNIKTYIYSGSAPSFHPKAYFFNGKEGEDSKLYIGSSNLSKVALTNGIEWNYRIDGSTDKDAISSFQFEFNNIIKSESVELNRDIIREYSRSYCINKEVLKGIFKSYYKPKSRRYSEKSEALPLSFAEDSSKKYYGQVENLFKPNSAQVEALLELKNTRFEGNEKALVVAATGVGKTFLAAFDSLDYQNILFIAHREEILNQAYETFAKVRGEDELGRYFDNYKDIKANILFASIQSLSRISNLKKFVKDRFDYIIVDELHHGVATSYTKVIDYFEPKFLLGLTATPHRLDKKDVYAICDYNSVYEIDLFTSINRGWLVPYKYYGIYDATVDYGKVKVINGRYVDKDLEKALSINKRAELILTNYKRYKRSKALGFCSNIKHAEFMASYFNENGFKAICIHSDRSAENYHERKSGIDKLQKGEIDIIFAVDMLSEGVDIPDLDLLLFLRPTQSPVVFLQQLGRGLRTYEGKNDVRILDFIGNFKKVDLIPFLLGNRLESKKDIARKLQNGQGLPMDCQVDFEFEVIDLIESVMKSKMKIQEKLDEWFITCREENEEYKIPSRIEFFNWLSDDQYQAFKKQKNYNPFKNYVKFVLRYDNATMLKDILGSSEYKFIQFIETTSMNQLYKLPVIESFVKDKTIKTEVTIDDIIDTFIKFYSNNRNRLDIVRRKTMGEPRDFTRTMWRKVILANPVKFLCKTNGDIFELEGELFKLKLEFTQIYSNEKLMSWFLSQVKDALSFRRCEFLDQRLELEK